MGFLSTFREWNPLEQGPPEQHKPEFSLTIERAQRVLEPVDHKTLEEIAKVTEAFLYGEHPLAAQLLKNERERIADPTRTAEDESYRTSDLATFWNDTRNDVKLQDYTSNPEIEWHHLLAMLALFYVACAREQEARHELNGDDPDMKLMSSQMLAAWMGEATGASLFAEKLLEEAQDRKQRAKRAGQSRHKSQEPVKNRFIEYYIENEPSGLFKSKAQAAKRFAWKVLTDAERKLFSDANIERTLLNALREHLRKQR